MIALILTMLRARRVQAVTVLLLCVFATAAAVAAPVAVRAVERGIVRTEVDAAGSAQRSLTLNTVEIVGTSNGQTNLEENATGVLALPGFNRYFSVEHFVLGLGRGLTRLAFRDEICAHLRIERGRCPMGLFEAIVGIETAQRFDLDPGETVRISFAHWDELKMIYEPAGPPATLTVVGIYQPADLSDPYWARGLYFTPDATGSRSEPIFADRRTLDSVYVEIRSQVLDLVAAPGTLSADNLARVRADVEELRHNVEDGEQRSTSLQTDLPALLDRIERSRWLAGSLMPVAFIPLVVLCWFVIYLAVGYGVFGRRHELGIVALRGVSPLRRWWLASGETVIAVLAGAPLGYLLGHLAVRQAALVRWGSTDGTDLSWQPLPYAFAALAGALLAALLGLRPELRSPVSDLLRRVPARTRQLSSMALEALVVVLGVLAALQLRGTDRGLTGLGVLVPGLIMAAVALVTARILVPASGWFARAALRRGRLGSALAAVQLARRPGSQRLLVLITVAIGLLAFVAAASDVAGRARRDRAAIESGASTVVLVAPIDARRLLSIVHAVDPEGAYAMAVGVLPDGSLDEPARLAVDSPRLAAAAVWRNDYGAGSAAELARALRPPVRDPILVRGGQLTIDLENRGPSDSPVAVSLLLAPQPGGPVSRAVFGEVAPGRATYTADAPGCAGGCRLAAVIVQGAPSVTTDVVFYALRQANPASVLITPAQFADRARWWSPGAAEIGTDASGLVVHTYNVGLGDADPVMPADVPAPLPVASTVHLAADYRLTGNDRRKYKVDVVAEPATLPRLGSQGIFVDLEYLERTSIGPAPFTQAEVWLGPAAPADAPDRLRAAGLPVTGLIVADEQRALLDRQGPALALWFHLLAAAFGLVLALGGVGLVAVVDRRRRAEDLRALRQQGLRPRFVRRATLWGQLVIVGTGVLAGLAAAAAAWLVAGDRLPVGIDELVPVAAARWPTPSAVAWPWALAAAALLLAAVVAAFDLRRAVARPGGSDDT
jgi:hypothetical protein